MATIRAPISVQATSVIHSNIGDNGNVDNIPLARDNIWADNTGVIRRITGDRSADTDGVIVG